MSDLALPATAAAAANDGAERDLRFGLIVAGIFFVLFLGWAALAPLDSAAAARGQLTTSGGRQSVQHPDGGVVAEIRVKEGQKVKQGQILIALAGAETIALERGLGGQLLNLEAQRARLIAEQTGARSVRWPADFGLLDPQPGEIADAVATQANEFKARLSLLDAQVGVLGQQAQEAGHSASGYGSQMTSSAEQERLIDEELAALRTVAEKGFVSKSRVRALERQKAELHGNRGQYQAGVAQARTEAGAGRLRQLEAVKQFRERAATELREVELQLSDLRPKYRAAHDQAQRLMIRAPVSGTVLALAAHTVGGVIAPGQTVMDIVPDRAELVVTARVSLDDAIDLQPGQAAEVRFMTLHDRGLPILGGTVTRVSADSLADEKSGQIFYTAEVIVPASEMAKLDGREGATGLRAGTPVDVLVPRKKRTALQYFLEPLTSTLWGALREH